MNYCHYVSLNLLISYHLPCESILCIVILLLCLFCQNLIGASYTFSTNTKGTSLAMPNPIWPNILLLLASMTLKPIINILSIISKMFQRVYFPEHMITRAYSTRGTKHIARSRFGTNQIPILAKTFHTATFTGRTATHRLRDQS